LRVVVTGASGFIAGKVMHLLRETPDIQLVPVTRKKIHNWHFVLDYADSPSGDILIHLAENSDRDYVANFGDVYERSTKSTLNALLEKGYQRIVYASSAVLYGDQGERPHLKGDSVTVVDAYTRVKYQSELAVLNSPAGIVARISNCYGIGMSESNVISTIIRQLNTSGPLRVANAFTIRDFISIDDVAEGIVTLALKQEQSTGNLYNLSTGIGTSVGTLASMILGIAGQSDRPVKSEINANKVSQLILDFSETTHDYGWKPKIMLYEGLVELLKKRGQHLL
jgi:UDP-glucose 4-epimerase